MVNVLAKKQLKMVLHNGTYQTTRIMQSATSQIYNQNWARISFPIASNIFFFSCTLAQNQQPLRFYWKNREQTHSYLPDDRECTYTLHFLGMNTNSRSLYACLCFFFKLMQLPHFLYLLIINPEKASKAQYTKIIWCLILMNLDT